jgi:hypothetical protein
MSHVDCARERDGSPASEAEGASQAGRRKAIFGDEVIVLIADYLQLRLEVANLRSAEPSN